MSLVNMLKRAEEQARQAARAGMQRTIVGLDDAERAIRRRMRIYPKQVPVVPLRTARAGTEVPPSADLPNEDLTKAG
jgi:hypothetical protein